MKSRAGGFSDDRRISDKDERRLHERAILSYNARCTDQAACATTKKTECNSQ
jgi:hypothetical protein